MNQLTKERINLLRAMNTVASAVTEADVYEEYWTDIPYNMGDYTNEQIVEMGLTDDTKFTTIMDNFLHLMAGCADENCGGLVVGNLYSTVGNED